MTTLHHLAPGDPASLLTADRRGRDLAALPERVDVLVVGGGITGAGVALDAATRGLSVVLAEGRDLAFGTSRWSSKLVHGGLRYLAKGEVGVAWESASERAIIAGRVAPHLIRPMPQLVPAFVDDRRHARLAYLLMRSGDAMRVAVRSPRGLLPGTRWVGAARARQIAPPLRRDGLVGATVGWDCQLEDDARLVVAVARTAAAYGARVLTACRVEDVEAGSGEALLRDGLTGTAHTLQAGTIVNATGVWAGELEPEIQLTPSLGTHVVLPSALLGDTNVSLTIPVPDHFGRMVFTLPKGDGLTFVGLTDHPMNGAIPDVPQPMPGDAHWMLNILSAALERPIMPEDAVGMYAGVRPLVADHGHTADISRRHLIRQTGRLLTVTGGKLTTYRRMAADVLDRVSERPCRTRDIALVGAGPTPTRPDVPEHLWRRYGNEAPDVWDLGISEPSLRQPLVRGRETIGAEVVFAQRAELALTVEDVAERRTRVTLRHDSGEAVAAIAALCDSPAPVRPLVVR